MNHNDRMTGEEWYHAQTYIGPGRFGTGYGRIRSPMELYPGHASYSEIQWYERRPQDAASQGTESAGIGLRLRDVRRLDAGIGVERRDAVTLLNDLPGGTGD